MNICMKGKFGRPLISPILSFQFHVWWPKNGCPIYQSCYLSCSHSYSVFLCCFHERDAAGDIHIDIIIKKIFCVKWSTCQPLFPQNLFKKSNFRKEGMIKVPFSLTQKTVQLTAMMIMFTWIPYWKIEKTHTFIYAGLVFFCASNFINCRET